MALCTMWCLRDKQGFKARPPGDAACSNAFVRFVIVCADTLAFRDGECILIEEIEA